MQLIKLLAPLLLVLTGCQKYTSNFDDRGQKDINTDVIYGVDDRIDFFEIEDPRWFELAQSTVALIDHKRLDPGSTSKHYKLAGRLFGETFHLCQDEPFIDQPSVGFCSGFLIGPELVVTAGHCIRNENTCNNVRLVFGFHYATESHDATEVLKKDVYRCKEIIHTEANSVTGTDFAILKLNKAVKNYQPLQLRTQGELTLDDNLTVIGYPSGLPGKLAHGGLVRNIESENFVVTTLDTYGGNSGSAVLNSETQLVEGILVRGDTDFVYDQKDQCRRSNVCQDTTCRGEDVVRIEKIFDHITPSELKPL